MSWIKKVIDYYQDNPQGYWFKRKLYGWGWVPVRWQGWLVVIVSLAIVFAGFYVGQTDDAPGAALLGVLLMLAVLFIFGYWKGEKPHWQWGFPEQYNKSHADGLEEEYQKENHPRY